MTRDEEKRRLFLQRYSHQGPFGDVFPPPTKDPVLSTNFFVNFPRAKRMLKDVQEALLRKKKEKHDD